MDPPKTTMTMEQFIQSFGSADEYGYQSYVVARAAIHFLPEDEPLRVLSVALVALHEAFDAAWRKAGGLR